MGDRAELVVLILERVRVDATDPDPALGGERGEPRVVVDGIPRNVERNALRDPRVARDGGGGLDLLVSVSRHAGLREHAEPRAGVDEAPRGNLDGELRR